MEPLTFEEKCEMFRKVGIDPKKLQTSNPRFFERILTNLRPGMHIGFDQVPDSFWFPEGNATLWAMNQPKPKTQEEKLKLRVRGKWSKYKAQALAEAELAIEKKEDTAEILEEARRQGVI
jgi:hypothetical protein